jgi:hypothetical protein
MGALRSVGRVLLKSLHVANLLLLSRKRTVGHSLERLSTDLAGQFASAGFLVDLDRNGVLVVAEQALKGG